MSEIRVDSIGNESNTGGPVLSGITTFSGQQYFIPPKGTTAERPSDCPPGSIRFNTDSAHLEYWNGSVWLEFEASSEELGNQNASSSESGGTGTRGIIGGVLNPASSISYFSFPTFGNTIDFGDLNNQRHNGVFACSSRTRAVFGGGVGRSDSEFITIASTGNGTSFGNLLNDHREGMRAFSNETRGIIFGGNDRPAFNQVNVLQYITIASAGDSIDFGDLIAGQDNQNYGAAMASSVRGVFGGSGDNPSNTNTIGYLTISTQGNSQDFGDLSFAGRAGTAGLSNSTRGIFAGADHPDRNVIDYVTIATTGNGQDFGDLTRTTSYYMGGASSTRGIISYEDSPNASMDKIEIATTGNAVEFGDDPITNGGNMDSQIASNGHGGL